MKKNRKKIAVLLIIAILAGSFTGCMSMWVLDNNIGIFLIFTVPLDIASLPIQIIVGIIYLVQTTKGTDEIQKKYQELDNVDTFSPEIILLSQRINSLPEEEIAPFTETIASFSKKEVSALLKAFDDLSEEEIDSSLHALASMPEETLIAVLNNYQYIEWRRQ